MRQIMLLWLVGLAAWGPAAAAALAQPAQVLIIRHGEQPPAPHATTLSLKGQERAMALAPFFTQSFDLIGHGLPVALFATKVTPEDRSQRTQETLTPLSRYLKVPIQARFMHKEFAWLAQEIMTNPAYKNKTVLVCWDHRYIPQLAASLGIRPEPGTWPEAVFDRIWIITFKGGTASRVNMPQRLLFGDAPE
jgi:hypothetical protein